MTTLILIRGLPGSGKSTLADCISTVTGAVRAEADFYFETPEGYKFDPMRLKDAHQRCQLVVDECLGNDTNVVVSNTFTTHREMWPYFDMAHFYGAQVQVIECHGTWKSVHDVPEETIERMRARWEPLDLSRFEFDD